MPSRASARTTHFLARRAVQLELCAPQDVRLQQRGTDPGQGGLYPVMDLRTHSFKNFRPCYLPEQLIIRNVREQFLAEDSARVERSLMRDRVDYCLRLLDAYASGFDGIRQQLPERDVAFSYGM